MFYYHYQRALIRSIITFLLIFPIFAAHAGEIQTNRDQYVVKVDLAGESVVSGIELSELLTPVAQTGDLEDGQKERLSAAIAEMDCELIVAILKRVFPVAEGYNVRCEPNVVLALPKALLNDPLSQSSQYALNTISAYEGWNYKKDSSDIIVAVLDTGIDALHPDLAGNMWVNPDDGSHGYNYVSNNTNVYDDNGHGTHVAGTIGASANNGIGVAGVTHSVQLMALKFLGSSGGGSLLNAVKAIMYAKNHGATIINASWGSYFHSTTLEEAVASFPGLFIAAAGNSTNDNDVTPHYPSNYELPNVISVASTDRNDNLSSFSNYGKSTVHIAAPGTGIVSTYPNNRYATLSGTSMAAPHVAGAVALLHAYKPGLNWLEVKDLLLGSAERMPSLYTVVQTGRLNILSMLSGQISEPTPGGYEVMVEHRGAKLRPKTRVTIRGNSSSGLNSYQLHFQGTDVVCDLGIHNGNISFRLVGPLAFLSHVPALSISGADPYSLNSDQEVVFLAQRAIKATLREKKKSANVRLLRRRALKRIEMLGERTCSKVLRSTKPVQ